MAKKKEKKKAKKILPGGLTEIQNEFMKLRLKNNPELAAKYFPNVILHPPKGPLYNVDVRHPFRGKNDYFAEMFGPKSGTVSPKAIYETTKPKKPGPFDYMELEHPTKGAQFTAENVAYDTPDSVFDIQSITDYPGAYAYTIPYYMNQDVGTHFIEGKKEGENMSEPEKIPITKGQSSTLYMKPEMVTDYGTDPKAPRNEMVPAPEWWPDKEAVHVNQAHINKFIEDVASHEVAHNVSYLPEYEGITSLAEDKDFKKIFPQFSSDEAQDVIKRLNILNEVGGAVYPPGESVMEWLSPYSQYDYPPPDARSLKMGFRKKLPEAVNPKYTTEFKKRIKPFNLEPEYESTLIDYGVEAGQEELYNRAKDIYRIKKEFPDTYKDHMAYINNMKFINNQLSELPNVFGSSGSKAETYLKEIEPQVIAYFDKLEKKRKEKAEGGRIGFDDGGPSQKEIDKGLKAIEKLKSSLMPESYEELIKIYKDKQKEVDIDIMESAGGLGEMLGEGGVAGHSPLALKQLPSQRKKKHIPHKFPKLGEGGRVGMMYGGDPGFAFSYGGSWADWKENHASEMPVMDYINQKLPKARNPFTDTKYQEGGSVDPKIIKDLIAGYMELGMTQEQAEKQAQASIQQVQSKAEGGRIGLANGTTMDLKYINPGFDKSEGMLSGVGGFPLIPAATAGAGILALSQKDKDKKTPQKTEGPNFPEPKPPFKIGDLIIDFIVANSRQPKPSEIGQLKEMLRVATEKITPTQRMKDQGVEGDFSDYEYTGDETTEDLYRFEEEGTIKRDDWNVFSPRYDEYLDAQIINKHHLYTVKEWENTPDTIKDKIRAQINPDWAEARFGEDWHEVLDKQRTNEIKQTEMFEDFDVKGRTKNATGGRIGFQEGTGIMSQTGIPYYADKAVEGIINSAETLSKLPFAGGELISKLLQSPPDKKMFSEAVENITPGSWAENLGISSLAEAEGAKVSPKQKTIGNVLGLGTEIAVPVGGAFKIGQNLINQASKSLGKLKKGKTLDQTINDKITSFGQSRRDFNIMAGTSGLLVALKAIGLGGLFKAAPTKDFAVKLKTYFHNSDVDYGTSGMATFDLTALTAPVRTALKSIMNKAQKFKHGNYGEKLSGKEYINIDPGDTKFIVKELQKKGFTGKFTGIADEGGDVLKQAEKAGQKDFVKTYKKQSMKQNVKDHQLYNDYVVYENDPGFLHWNEATKGKLNKPFVSTIDEVVEILEPVVKKGEGGSVGYPPLGPDQKPQGPFYETNNPNEAFKEILRRSGGSGITRAPLPGGFSLDVPYGQYGPNPEVDIGLGFNTDPMSSGFSAGYGVNLDGNNTMGAVYNSPDDSFNIGVRKQEGSDPQWNFQKKWKFGGPKNMKQGGKVWQPKSAPKLTTTIPPERGPTPQGLTYLVGDDIVQNIGYKHGRN